MKRKKILLAIAVLLTCVVAGWWSLHRKSPVATPVYETGQIRPTDAGSRVGERGVSGATSPAESATAISPDDSVKNLAAAVQEADNEWRALIEFFGKVVDETGSPVAGANVDLSWNNLQGTQSAKTQSDANGLFSLQGQEGKFLAVTVSKEGYYAYKPHGEGFFYAGRNENFIPDAANPVVFRLHKRRPGEQLVHATARLKVPLKGQPIKVDLASARIVLSGGDLELKCLSNYEARTTDRVFDWQLTISVPGGGVVESIQEFDFIAPEAGYSRDLEISMPANKAGGWQEIVERKFFLKLANGNFARSSIRFYSYNGVLVLESFINPGGSRNLENDPAVQSRSTILHE